MIREAVNQGNHGGLRVDLTVEGKRVARAYRATFAGALDFANNKADALWRTGNIPGDKPASVQVANRPGATSRDWRIVHEDRRLKETMFHH